MGSSLALRYHALLSVRKHTVSDGAFRSRMDTMFFDGSGSGNESIQNRKFGPHHILCIISYIFAQRVGTLGNAALEASVCSRPPHETEPYLDQVCVMELGAASGGVTSTPFTTLGSAILICTSLQEMNA